MSREMASNFCDPLELCSNLQRSRLQLTELCVCVSFYFHTKVMLRSSHAALKCHAVRWHSPKT